MKPSVLIVCCVAAGSLRAQIGQFPGTSVPLVSVSQSSAHVPAGSNLTLLNVTNDAPVNGQDVMDVLVGDLNVVITLIRPDGTESTASNA